MSAYANAPLGGTRAPVTGPGAARGAAKNSTYDALERQSRLLDDLLRDVAIGARSAHHYDQLADTAFDIARGIEGAFRAMRPQEHPPIVQQGGRAVW